MERFLTIEIYFRRIYCRSVDSFRIHGCHVLIDREMGLAEQICGHHGEEIVSSLAA